MIGDLELFAAGHAANLVLPRARESRDLVVTVPAWFWQQWLDEGDCVGDPESGDEWLFSIGPRRPREAAAGARVYVVAHGRLRGYAPLVRVACVAGSFALTRAGGAVACTIDESIPGFRGFRYRWWDRSRERPFPEWREPFPEWRQP